MGEAISGESSFEVVCTRSIGVNLTEFGVEIESTYVIKLKFQLRKNILNLIDS